ncbi:helix-turn-helix domain-containing protein [Enterococcus alcedinis]|uniref:DNA-binding response regulator n=1 Tax=Enterococcus alcedinis TaxID=1274384 RepID=A0A917N485_9ENTE|nr:helix-turn-helix domain-containing protein [Enterococcus alcedinis]MBP2101779.1 YesN/AraC family two-component response regulator [Enterococcus alcedinis]GGI65343.1 DNA-binding response regulator [Enterococcus alcedinis]
MKRVVIIDDEKMIVEGLNFFLKERFPNDLSIVKTYLQSEEALIELKKISFDILITDICMLNMTGLELIKEIQKQKEFEAIVVSAYHNFDYAKESIDLGVRTYLTKPIDFEKLSTVIEKIIDESPKHGIEQREQFSKVTNQLIAVIQEDYVSDLYLNGLAEKLHYNAAYLGQLFQKEVGEPFNLYLLNYRIEKAKELLHQTEWSVDEISHAVGFQTPTYFIRMFKNHIGLTPLKYRKTL